MRLAVVTNDYPPKAGGIQQYLGSLVAAYPDEVLVLAPADGTPGRSAVEATSGAGGATTVVRHDRSFMVPTRSLADWVGGHLAEFRPDAVLIGAPSPLGGLVAPLQRRLDVPVGVLAHGAEVTLPAAVPGPRSVLRSWLAAADARFAVSRYTAANVERLTGADTTYIGAGVDLEVFAAAPPPDRAVPLIGCVSRFVPRKGQDRLIDAVARLRAEGVACDLMLVGTGRTEASLRRHAAGKGVPVRFEVDVPWSRLPGLYAEMDVFCMPCRSRWGGLEAEGLGLVFLEAASVGRPVVAGDSGGSPETVDPGDTGFVVHDVDGIVEALRILLADATVRQQMGRAGRRRVEAEFTWRHAVERLVSGFRAAG